MNLLQEHRKLIIIFCAALFTVFVVGLLVLFFVIDKRISQPSSTSPTSSPTATKSLEVPKSDETYENKTYGYKFTYPNNWYKFSYDDTSVMFSLNQKDTKAPVLSFLDYKNSQSTIDLIDSVGLSVSAMDATNSIGTGKVYGGTFESYKNFKLKLYTPKNPNEGKIISQEDIMVDGVKAYKLVYTSGISPVVSQKDVKVFILKEINGKKYEYIIDLNGHEGPVDKYMGEYDKLISSLKFL
jgi:hypothetical protein